MQPPTLIIVQSCNPLACNRSTVQPPPLIVQTIGFGISYKLAVLPHLTAYKTPNYQQFSLKKPYFKCFYNKKCLDNCIKAYLVRWHHLCRENTHEKSLLGKCLFLLWIGIFSLLKRKVPFFTSSCCSTETACCQ